MVNNGTMHYDHDRDGTHTELAGCEAQFRNKPHDTYVAIRYERNTLTVSSDWLHNSSLRHSFVDAWSGFREAFFSKSIGDI